MSSSLNAQMLATLPRRTVDLNGSATLEGPLQWSGTVLRSYDIHDRTIGGLGLRCSPGLWLRRTTA